jgi:hypothetical protein
MQELQVERLAALSIRLAPKRRLFEVCCILFPANFGVQKIDVQSVRFLTPSDLNLIFPLLAAAIQSRDIGEPQGEEAT